MKAERLLESSELVNPDVVRQARIRLSESRYAARAWACQFPDVERNVFAGCFAERALRSYAWAVAPSLYPMSPPAMGLDRDISGLADQLAAQATLLPSIEALHELTSLYTVLLPASRRSALGAFYTPPVLAHRLAEMATEAGTNWGTARILDPAAGGGAFLIQAAVRMAATTRDSEPEFRLAQIENRLVGLELDQHAARLAQLALEIFLADLIELSGRPMKGIVRVIDSLQLDADSGFDLVIGNPPYGRIGLDEFQRRRFARSLYGHANLYGLFTDAAIGWVKKGGLVAYLTPTGMLGGQYFRALRKLLAQEAPPSAVNLVHSRRGVFEDALQEILLAVYHKGSNSRPVDIDHLTVANECEASIQRNGTVDLPADPASPWIIPRSPEDSGLVASLSRMPARLSDLGYRVSTGPLVWNRFKPQLEHTANGRNLPIIWAESVTSDGRFVHRARRRNHAPFFNPAGRKDDWLIVRKPCVLVQRTTAKEQARRLIAAELTAGFLNGHKGVVVENHLNMVVQVGASDCPPFVIAAVLNSRAADRAFRCISGSVAVSAFELEALPFPARSQLKQLQNVMEQGGSLEELNMLIDGFYGVKG